MKGNFTVLLAGMLSVLSWSVCAMDERFIDTSEGIIHDNVTGLMWTRNAKLEK